MKKAILLLLIMVSFFDQLYSQKTYNIKDFSRLYDGIVYIEDTDDEEDTHNYDVIAKVRIFDKASREVLIETETEINIILDIDNDGEIGSNILEIPYGTQSLVICRDFNCDGTDDIAIKIGNFSCYGGPAFDVYINKDGIFKKDSILSELAQDYCGMYSLDCEKKEINVMTKGGCCWHLSKTYTIIDGIPQFKKSVEEDAISFFPLMITTIEMRDGKEYIYKKICDDEDIVFRFNLQNRKKSVLLYFLHNQLIYALQNEEGYIDFMYPLASRHDPKSMKFTLTQNGNRKELTFSNSSAIYTIYESDQSVGIEVYTKKKLYKMKGDWTSKIGYLSALEDLSVENLSIIKSE